MNKRIKSLLLCLVMAFTLVAAAAPALAASEEPMPAAEAAPNDGDIEFTPSGPGSDTNPIPQTSIRFTKNIKLGGDVAPGAQNFELEILNFADEDGESYYPGVSYEATVETNGAGDYEGRLVISGPESEVSGKIAVEEFFVREKNTGVDKWTYDDAVWCVKGDDEGTFTFYPAQLNENGGYSCGEEAAEKMVFENTYTENKPAPTATPKPTSPKTGDESTLALWLTLLLGGTAAAGVVIGARKKSSK